MWVAAALLAWACLSLLREPMAVAVPEARPAAEQQKTPDSPGTAAKAIGDYPTIASRPLFHANRKPVGSKPAAVVTERKENSPESPDFKLIAVIIDGDAAVALLRLKGNAVKRVHSGSIIDGWRIKEIRRKSIVVANKEKDWIVAMEKHGSPAAADRQRTKQQDDRTQ